MATTCKTIGEASGRTEPEISPYLNGIQREVDSKYRAWCQRRGLNPFDVHDYGLNSGSMRLAIANQARAGLRRKQRTEEKEKHGTTDCDI